MMNKINELIYSKRFGKILAIILVVLCILATIGIKKYGLVESTKYDEELVKITEDRHNG